MQKVTIETAGLQPIDIRSPGFFWVLHPWKEGTLATIDGWGRFAEISFTGADRMRIRPLVNFPRAEQDRRLITWPEAGLIASTSGKMHHLAAVDDNKTISHAPLLSWVHREREPVLLDSREGLVAYGYSLKQNDNDTDTRLFIYNYKENRMVYESPESGFSIVPSFMMDDHNLLSWKRILDGNVKRSINVFYNWRTNQVWENDLTEAANKNDIDLLVYPHFNIHPVNRYMFGYSGLHNDRVKVSWDEDYSGVKITPLSYLRPAAEIRLLHFNFSANGQWAATLTSGYRGLNNERLRKRAFLHFDERYPGGISMPVVTEEYLDYVWDYSAFVNHPVHGMCFAHELRKKEGFRERLYLRLYKMDDVLAEINRKLAEEADEALNGDSAR